MRKLLFLLCLLTPCRYAVAQQVHAEASVSIDLNAVEHLQAQHRDELGSAAVLLQAIDDANAYIHSLSDLFTNEELSLPVGIKQGDYVLAIEKILLDEHTGQSLIEATCAFRFKDDGQLIAFRGQAALEGRNGLGTTGSLSLIAPVRRNLGREAAIVIREGTTVNFGCYGVESFDARLAFVITSPLITAVDGTGAPVDAPIAFGCSTTFHSFDSYTLSLDIDRRFAINGLPDFIFTLRSVTLDQSDTDTPAEIAFPDNYFAGEADRKLWKGLGISDISVGLPPVFKQQGGTGRLTAALRQALFDNNGFSGTTAVHDLLSSDDIRRDRWELSLTDFSLGFLKNKLVAFGLGGDVNIPPFGKHSLLPYTAVFNHAKNEYEFKVNLSGEFDFPALHGTLTLHELSHIEILFKDADIYPRIDASGRLSVNVPLGADSSGTQFTVPELAFEHLIISREAPYLRIGAIGVTGDVTLPKLGNFELSLTDIRTFQNSDGGGLRFDAGVAVSDLFKGETGIQLHGDYARWKFKEISVDRVRVQFKSSAFSLDGNVAFMNADALYGNGFRGDIRFTLVDKFTFDAIGVFGKKEDYRYFLVDAFFESNRGIPFSPMLEFNGFGGGLYRQMQQTTRQQELLSPAATAFGESLSGIRYVPDRQVSMGVMASAKFGLIGSPNAFNARAGFEMQFNRHGGLNFLQLRGIANFVEMPDKLGTLQENIAAQYNDVATAGIPGQKASKSSLDGKVPETVGQGSLLTAAINVDFDLLNNSYTADLNAYLNAGIIHGIGPNGRMGWASAHFSPDKWYIYAGTPSDRMGIKVVNLATVNGYFMLGNSIPGLPPPPNRVLNNLSPSVQEKLKRTGGDMTTGKGIAFGTGLEVAFSAKLFPFYADFALGIGAEFALRNRGNYSCANYSGQPGLNGWYAEAQAWAYMEADIGIAVKLFMRQLRLSILDISAGAALRGAGPRPLYFSGTAGGQFSVLGGLVKGNCSFDFEVGEQCIMVKSGSPFGEDIIADLTPAANSKDVNVFAKPQALFNVPVNVEMAIDEDDGSRNTYMATLETFTVKHKGGSEVAAVQQFDTEGKVCALKTEEPFESQKEMEARVKVGFKKKTPNGWVAVTDGSGQPLYEEKKVAFITGDRPKEIMPEHVKYSYPIDRQYNYYPDEYKKGYILLSENYAYLFTTEKPKGFDQEIQVTDASGNKYSGSFTYRGNGADNGIRVEIDFSTEAVPFGNDRLYRLAIVNVPQAKNVSLTDNVTTTTTAMEGMESVSINRQQATGTLVQAEEKTIYALNFKTSKWNTFADKIKSIDKKEEGWRDYVTFFVHNIQTNLRGSELFDSFEVYGTDGTNRLIGLEALPERTQWYAQSIYPEMYRAQSTMKIEQNRASVYVQQNYGAPPVKAIFIDLPYREKRLTDDEINMGIATGYHGVGQVRYSLPFWCAQDFEYVKREIANRCRHNKSLTTQEIQLLNRDHPPVVTKGDYPVKFTYILPGRKITTSAVEMTMYNPFN